MQKPSKITPILIGTLVVVVISSFPILNFINFIFCAGVMAGSIAGVYYYNKKLTGTDIELTYKDGAIIGAASGMLSAVIFILIVVFAVLFLKILNINLGQIIKDIFTSFGLGSGKDKLTKKIVDEYTHKGYSITHLITVTVIYGISYPLFGLLGGILGSAIFISKNKSIKKIKV